jgi:hypothetical protein
MQYEIYLRASDPKGDVAARILADLAGDPDVSRTPDGDWEYAGEDGTIAVAPHPAEDSLWKKGTGDTEAPLGPLGLDLNIAGGAGEGLATQLAELAFDWAARWSLDVYDPQLGRTVKKDDLEAVVARIRQHSDYLTDTVGLGEQSTRYMDVDAPVVRMGLRTRFYLGLAAALLLLGLLAHYCS